MISRKIFKKIRKRKRKNLTEFESRMILEQYKIPLAKAEATKTVDDAIKFAKKIGFPVVIKIISPDILHKTDIGGVILNIKNVDELQNSFRQLLSNMKRKAPKAKILGVLVQKMVENGREVIIGGKKDSQFGQVIMFGGGGILTEIMEDVSFRVCPIDRKNAKEMIEETRYFKVLKGYRGMKCDINSLISILLKVSRLLEENQEISELDINPVISLPKNAIAVDARIIID